MPALPRSADRTLEAIEEIAGAGLPAQELLAEVARRIDEVVPSDGSFLTATDPQTTLSIGAGIVRDLPFDQCKPTWDYEFLVPDYLKFTDIARSGRTVADLHEATGGTPERSPRWREFGTATGFRSELRATFTLGGLTWGIAQFDRLGDAPRFSGDEQRWLERLTRSVARGLRQAMLTPPSAARADRGPGLVLLDPSGEAVSVTPEAAAWLEEVDSMTFQPTDIGVLMPVEAHAYASKVRAAARDDALGRLDRARMRTRAGVWLTVHGSVLQDTSQLALIIEPAKASDVAPLIIEAYGLTQREVEVTRMVARGLGTSRIAEDLVLSPHTVRDHVKSVLEKVGVSSRGELIAKVFADHYAPPTAHV
jgi:DNA-binding CsgD family transcriptional regulator